MIHRMHGNTIKLRLQLVQDRCFCFWMPYDVAVEGIMQRVGEGDVVGYVSFLLAFCVLAESCCLFGYALLASFSSVSHGWTLLLKVFAHGPNQALWQAKLKRDYSWFSLIVS